MLSKVEVRSPQGGLLSLPLDDISGGYSVRNIDGLDPVKATIVSSSFARLDGTQYQSSKREPRNVVMTLGYEPDYAFTSVWDLRQALYQYFMSKSQVNLRFYHDNGLTVNIDGRVESCESPLFVQDPKADISIMCDNPDFLELTESQVVGTSTTSVTTTPVTYEGTVETGFVFVLHVNATLTEFSLYNTTPDGSVHTIDFAGALQAGDVVTINTIPSQKAATLLRADTVSSILYGISPQSDWIALQPGVNNIRLHATVGAIPYDISYTNRYGGL